MLNVTGNVLPSVYFDFIFLQTIIFLMTKYDIQDKSSLKNVNNGWTVNI